MAYPLDYTDLTPYPSGTTLVSDDDHAARHSTEGAAITNIEHVIGLSSGSAVLEDFVTGERAVRMNTSNVLQQAITGTVNLTGGTPNLNAGTLNNMVIGTPSITGGTLTNFLWDGWQSLNGDTWTATGYNSTYKTGTITTSADYSSIYNVGMKTKFVQGGTTIYGLFTSVSGSTITIYTGNVYSMGTTAITNNLISRDKCPRGFSQSDVDWTYQVAFTGDVSQGTPVNGTWYTFGTANVPIGYWRIDYQGVINGYKAAGAQIIDVWSTLGTTAAAETNKAFTAEFQNRSTFGTANQAVAGFVHRYNNVELAAHTTYYLNLKSESSSIDTLTLTASNQYAYIRARPMYL